MPERNTEALSATPLLYERQPSESDRAFAAFCCYRDLGPKRSLDEVGKRLYGGQSGRKRAATGRVQAWSSKWHWRERVAAWDAHLDRQTREAQEQARREMGERHAKLAVALQEKAIQRLKAMPLEELSSTDLLRYIIEAAKLERLARGEPESIQEQRGTVAHEHQVEIFARIQQYAEAFRPLLGPGVEAGSVRGDGRGEPIHPPPADREAEASPPP
jgi:hypothetical protein